MSLKTKTRIRRSHWKLMATTELIINTMKYFEEKPLPFEPIPEQEQQKPTEPEVEAEITEPAMLQEEEEDAEVPELIDAPESDDDEDEVSEPGIATHTRSRTGTEMNPPERYK